MQHRAWERRHQTSSGQTFLGVCLFALWIWASLFPKPLPLFFTHNQVKVLKATCHIYYILLKFTCTTFPIMKKEYQYFRYSFKTHFKDSKLERHSNGVANRPMYYPTPFLVLSIVKYFVKAQVKNFLSSMDNIVQLMVIYFDTMIPSVGTKYKRVVVGQPLNMQQH